VRCPARKKMGDIPLTGVGLKKLSKRGLNFDTIVYEIRLTRLVPLVSELFLIRRRQII